MTLFTFIHFVNIKTTFLNSSLLFHLIFSSNLFDIVFQSPKLLSSFLNLNKISLKSYYSSDSLDCYWITSSSYTFLNYLYTADLLFEDIFLNIVLAYIKRFKMGKSYSKSPRMITDWLLKGLLLFSKNTSFNFISINPSIWRLTMLFSSIMK